MNRLRVLLTDIVGSGAIMNMVGDEDATEDAREESELSITI